MHQSSRYDVNKYGDRCAGILAREWGKRMQYFYDIYCARAPDGGQYRYTAEDIESYRPSADYAVACAELNGKALERALSLAHLVP